MSNNRSFNRTNNVITQNPRPMTPRPRNHEARMQRETVYKARRHKRQSSREQRQLHEDTNKANKGIAITVAITGLALALIFVVVWNQLPNSYETNPKWAGNTQITYDEVNSRATPAGLVIGTLEKEEKVTTTGRRSYFIDLDGRMDSDHWSEIQLSDGSLVWVIGSAVEND